MLFHNKENQNSIRIRFTRDSVCMGDDCMAPNEEKLKFDASDTLLDLMQRAARYVPRMRDYKWEVMCGREVLGTLTSGSDAEYEVELKRDDGLVSALPEREIFCRKNNMPQNSSGPKEVKAPHDMITDGVLAYGVNVGRFVFEEEGYTVYVISDLPHIGPSDVFMVYQISKADYDKLRSMSCTGRIPDSSVPKAMTDACRKKFLCGESAYCKRYYCALADVDMSLAERIPSQAPEEKRRPAVMNYCPECGTKNNGGKYCSECGTKLIKP